MMFSEMDIFMGGDIIDGTMRFRATSPINDNFELFGFGDKNFMLNSGSFFIIQIGFLFYFLGRWLLNLMAKRMSQFRLARNIGIWAHEQNVWLKMKTAFKKLMLESYFDIIFCAMINLIALSEAVDSGEISKFFRRRDDFVSSTMTIFYTCMIFVFPVYVTLMINRNFKRLGHRHIQEQHGIFYEGVVTKTRLQVNYNIFFMVRRLATVLTLIFLRHLPFFQCQVLLLLSTVNFIYVYTVKPLSPEENKIEVFNEFTIAICSHITNVFLNIAVSLETRDLLGWVLMGVALMNILVNLCVIAFSSGKLFYI